MDCNYSCLTFPSFNLFFSCVPFCSALSGNENSVSALHRLCLWQHREESAGSRPVDAAAGFRQATGQPQAWAAAAGKSPWQRAGGEGAAADAG